MAKKSQARARDLAADRAVIEKTIRELDYEGADRVLDLIGVIEAPEISFADGWHKISLAGIEAIAPIGGWPLLQAWAAKYRRELARGALAE